MYNIMKTKLDNKSKFTLIICLTFVISVFTITITKQYLVNHNNLPKQAHKII